MRQSKSDSEICQAFDMAIARLDAHGITVQSNGAFHLTADGVEIGAPESVDGLTAFADALDYTQQS